MKKIILLIILNLSFLITYSQDNETVKTRRTFFEVSFNKNHASLSLPGLMKGAMNSVKGGIGNGFGFGWVSRKKKFEFRGGLQFWKHPIEMNFKDDETEPDYTIERGYLNYAGPYFRLNYSIPHFFIGGGFDFSVSQKFKGDRFTYNNNQLTSTNKDIKTSLLTNSFTSAVRLTINIGTKIPLGKNISLKPFAELALSLRHIAPKEEFQEIANTPWYTISYDEPVQVGILYFPVVNYGIMLEL